MAPPRKPLLPASKPLKEYKIECEHPAKDGILNTVDFKRFLEQTLKVDGKKHNLENVKISLKEDTDTISIETKIPLTKRYLKYLTKKYLNKNHMKDWVRVMAPNNKCDTYVLKYYKIINDDDDQDDMSE